MVRRSAGLGEVEWDPGRPLDPAKVAGCDAVVHLAGRNVAGYWTKKFKQEIRESRVQGTRTVAEAAAESFRRTGQPRILLSASATGYYGSRGDEVLNEHSTPGMGFLAGVSQEWEAATEPARAAGLRVVNLRIGVVLSRHGGALKAMLLPFQLGLGGRVGDGRQFWSWIALDDVAGAILFALQSVTLDGPLNLTSPNPARNAEFVRALGEALHRPRIFPLPAWIVNAVMGEMGNAALLGSARVIPEKLQAAGYRFRYAELKDALRAVLNVPR